MVKIDTEKEYLDIFKWYEIPLFTKLLSEDIGMTTKEAWDYVLDQIYPQKISRTSVIFSLQEFAERGILKISETTGKGGYRGIYSRNMNLEEFWQHISNQVNQALEPYLYAESS